jgi:ADP-heptose:LPS heptosyltransferase
LIAPILLYRPGAIGDTLLLWPTLLALRAAYPNTPLVLVGHPAVTELFLANRLVDRYLSRDGPAADALFAPADRLAHEQIGPLSAAIAWTADPQGRLRANLTALGADPCILAPSRPLTSTGPHVAQHLYDSLAPFGLRGWAADWIRPIDPVALSGHPATLSECDSLVMLHPGSGGRSKNWPVGRFVALADQLARQRNATVVATFGPADAEARASFAADTAVLLDSPPLLELSGLFSRSALYVGNDSGISHLAGLSGAPSLVLFGPTEPMLWQPLGRTVVSLRREPLESLELDRVLDQALSLLDAASGRM